MLRLRDAGRREWKLHHMLTEDKKDRKDFKDTEEQITLLCLSCLLFLHRLRDDPVDEAVLKSFLGA